MKEPYDNFELHTSTTELVDQLKALKLSYQSLLKTYERVEQELYNLKLHHHKESHLATKLILISNEISKSGTSAKAIRQTHLTILSHLADPPEWLYYQVMSHLFSKTVGIIDNGDQRSYTISEIKKIISDELGNI